MADLTLEERVKILEQQVADLKATLANTIRVKDWRRTIGMFAGDEGMQQLFEEAMKIREADRERARRRWKRGRRAKS